jgi:hypothetical protein
LQNLTSQHTGDDESTIPFTEDEGNITTELAMEARKALSLLAEEFKLPPHGQVRFAQGMQLELEMIETGERMRSAVDHDLVVGRGDNLSDFQPDIDLTPFGAYRLGLSRRHAILRRENETLVVQDLNSRNGTHINGKQIESGELRPLRDGDEVRFGNLALRVNFKFT